MDRIRLCLVLTLAVSGCVSRSDYNAVNLERERLASEVERLELERASLEEQFYEAQESYEDERVSRTSLATDLERVEKRAAVLDESLAAERDARIETAAALAAREAELARIQSTYDEMVADLESEVSAGQIEIERLRDGLRLNVSDEVLFATGSARLDAIGREVLTKVAGQLKSLNDFVEVLGHTDDRRIGGALARRYPTNWELAAARASRVVRLLEAEGVPGERLAAVSRGPFDPVAPNDTSDNRALNRRIEIRLLPTGQRGQAPGQGGEPRSEREAAPAESSPSPSTEPEAASETGSEPAAEPPPSESETAPESASEPKTESTEG